MKTLIYDVIAVTMEDEAPVIENAFIAVDGNKISYVGSERPEGDFDREIDGRGKVAMPGLVNTHSHIAMTLLRSYADDMNLQEWLFTKIFPFEDTLTGDDIKVGTEIGVKEMLASGTTCFLDMYFFEKETACVAEKLGIRAILCDCIMDNDLEARIEKVKALVEQTKDSSLVRVAVGPHAVYTCSKETLMKSVALAKEYDLLIHTHLSETKQENLDCMRDHGISPTQYMDECGMLTEKTIAAHCVWLSDDDIKLLKERGVTVSHNPISNLKLASGVAPVPKLKDAGVSVTIGTDGASSNNNLDMFEEIKLTGILHKGINYDPTVLPAYEVLKMATVYGAKVLGYDNLGMLKENYLADIIMLDFDVPHLTPNHNTISHLVYAANGSDVCMTMVDGRVVYER